MCSLIHENDEAEKKYIILLFLKGWCYALQWVETATPKFLLDFVSGSRCCNQNSSNSCITKCKSPFNSLAIFKKNSPSVFHLSIFYSTEYAWVFIRSVAVVHSHFPYFWRTFFFISNSLEITRFHLFSMYTKDSRINFCIACRKYGFNWSQLTIWKKAKFMQIIDCRIHWFQISDQLEINFQ